MHSPYKDSTKQASQRSLFNARLFLGVIGGMALLVGMSLTRAKKKSRRYSDQRQDRRQPLNQFAAGVFPQRREIDGSGKRPLFERRQSAYDTY